MPWIVTGLDRESGEPREEAYFAKDEEQAIQYACNNGVVVENTREVSMREFHEWQFARSFDPDYELFNSQPAKVLAIILMLLGIVFVLLCLGSLFMAKDNIESIMSYMLGLFALLFLLIAAIMNATSAMQNLARRVIEQLKDNNGPPRSG